MQGRDATKTHSWRVSRLPMKYGNYYMHLQTQTHPVERTREYTTEEGWVIAKILEYMLYMQVHPKKKKAKQFMQKYGMKSLTKQMQMVQTCSLKSGLKCFGNHGQESAMKEIKQLDGREVFYPVNINELTDKERKRVMETFLFLVEKRDGKVLMVTASSNTFGRVYAKFLLDYCSTVACTKLTYAFAANQNYACLLIAEGWHPSGRVLTHLERPKFYARKQNQKPNYY